MILLWKSPIKLPVELHLELPVELPVELQRLEKRHTDCPEGFALAWKFWDMADMSDCRLLVQVRVLRLHN